jgi:hypothetical protein
MHILTEIRLLWRDIGRLVTRWRRSLAYEIRAAYKRLPHHWRAGVFAILAGLLVGALVALIGSPTLATLAATVTAVVAYSLEV